jgi:hypothetical protein
LRKKENENKKKHWDVGIARLDCNGKAFCQNNWIRMIFLVFEDDGVPLYSLNCDRTLVF